MSSHASMNRVYRLVFNAATGMYVAVAETARGRGKAGRSAGAVMLAALTALGGLSSAGAQNVLPTGGVVTTNNATISQTSSTLTVNQTGNAAILNWQSFSVGAANSVRFNQPSASAIALNRVVGNSASEILGSISANGKVMLVNQNGILMGSGAQVDTGGFMGSTLNIKDSDFLAGKYIFDIANNTGGVAGSIINNGRITTPTGYAVLIAPQVTNNGFIAARQGTVAIGAGNKVSLDMVGDGLISLKVDQAALNAAVVNSGSINANGGTVLLKASSANALFDTVINSTGVIRADSISSVNGRIILDGGSTGITEVTGEISARGLNAGETGGSISVLGDKVGLMGSGRLDSSGDAGGGTVLVGGNWQGSGTERTASRTIVASNASIDVSATNNGNGGTAVVWSDGLTNMNGGIKATGGAQGGNGGNVETSGKQALDLQGSVDIAAANGSGGQWLLDPNNISISSVTANTTIAGTTYQDDAGAATATISAGALGTALTGGATVNVQTSNAGTGGGQGGIDVTTAITATGAATLNLIANGAINVIGTISNAAGSALNVGLYAGSSGTPATIATAGSQTGSIGLSGGAIITTNGGKVTMVGGAGSGVTTSGAINTAGGDVTINAGGALNLNSAINAGAGTVRLQSTGSVAAAAITAANLGVRGVGVNMGTAANVVSGNVAISSTSAANLLYKSATNFAVGSVAADGTLFTATAGFTSTGNKALIDSAGAVTQTAGNNITASGLELMGAGAFTLTEATNSVGTLAVRTGAGAIKYVNAGALTVGTVFVSGITRAGDVSLRAVTGDLAVNNVFSIGSNTARLQADAGTVTQAGVGVITAANLGARGTSVDLTTASNAVSTDVALNASTGAAKLKNGAAFNVGSVTADGTVFTGTTGVTTTNQDITLNAGGALAVNQAVNAGTGTVRLQSTGAVTQAAAGVITAANLGARGTAVDLSTADNVVSVAVGINASAGNVLYKSTPSFQVGSVTADGTLFTVTGGISAAGNNVTLDSAAAVTQTTIDDITASGLLLKGAGAYTLANTTNSVTTIAAETGAGALKYVNAGALMVGTVGSTNGITRTGDVELNTQAGALAVNQAINAGTSTVRLQSAAAITQAVAGVITAANLGARGTAVDLSTAANVVSTSVGINASAGNVLYKSTTGFALGSIAVDGILFSSAASGLSAAGNNVTIDSAGAVTQTPGNRVTASGLLLKGAGAYTLTTTNRVTTIAAETGAGAVKYVNAGALTVGTVGTTDGITRAGNVALNAQTGNLTLAKDINTGTNANQVTLQALAGAVNQTAGVITTGTLGARAGGGDVALGSSSNAVGTNVALAALFNVSFKNAGSYRLNTVAADAPFFSTAVNGITSGAGNIIDLNTSAGTVTQASGKAITSTGGLKLGGDAAYTLTDATNNVSLIAASTGSGAISYTNAGPLTVGTVNVSGITRTGNVALATLGGAALTQTQAIAAANLDVTGGQAVTLTNAGNNIASLSGNTAALSLTNTSALALGALTVTGGTLNLTTGGTLSQTGALTQSGVSPGIILNATTGNIKLTNAANDVSGMAIMTASAGGVAFTNNNAAGIKVGPITAATSMNTTNPADIANFTASDAALTGVVLLQARQGNIESAPFQGTPKIVADRAVLVAANRIGGALATDAVLGVRVEGAAGASMREVYLSAATTASTFGPATVPVFYNGLKNGATTLASPTATTYNGAAVTLTTPGTTANTPATATTNTNDALKQAQAITQIEQPKSNSPPQKLNGVNNTLLDATRVEPITIPSCAPGAARPALPGQC